MPQFWPLLRSELRLRLKLKLRPRMMLLLPSLPRHPPSKLSPILRWMLKALLLRAKLLLLNLPLPHLMPLLLLRMLLQLKKLPLPTLLQPTRLSLTRSMLS